MFLLYGAMSLVLGTSAWIAVYLAYQNYHKSSESKNICLVIGVVAFIVGGIATALGLFFFTLPLLEMLK
ncbi:MAG: hypothetical protein G01um101419_796 [Parcubacteria group bacterium Gr01-1014_19]|nr:MAG: hypothetical protein G01um101419_796 [Parcubacteria group bacterium Gr01-1014_19]